AIALLPSGIQVEHVSQLVVPIGAAFGVAGVVIALLGLFAATLGAALECALSSGYSLAQYFGWEWGKRVPPRNAARFHVSIIVVVLLAVAVVQTGIAPVRLTEATLIASAAALPLTYLPILLVANDREYLGKHANGPFANVLGVIVLILVLVAAVTAI